MLEENDENRLKMLQEELQVTSKTSVKYQYVTSLVGKYEKKKCSHPILINFL